jgi:transposase
LLEKAEFLLANKSKIKASNKRGGKKYLQAVGGTDWVLDKGALARDEKFDGYYAVQTSEPNLTAETILGAYHTLWKIEESFRIMKSTLEVRPIFHWTPNRIRGHFVLCFLTFLLERTLEIELCKTGLAVSPQVIRDTMNGMQITEMQYHDKKYFLRSDLTELGSKVLHTLSIRPPRNSGPMENLNLG